MRILWLQRWVVIGSVVLVLFGAVAYQSTVHPRYTSSVSLSVNPGLTTPNAESGVSSITLDPLVVRDPAIVDKVSTDLGMPPDQVGTVSASATQDEITITATADSPVAAKDLANAFAPAVADAVKAQVPEYMARLQTSVTSATDQLDKIAAGGSSNPLLQEAQSSIVIEQYKAVFKQQTDAQAASANPVTISDSAPLGSLATVSLTLAVEVALLAGLLVGVGLALIRNWLDGRVVDAVDVQLAVDAPVVGALPLDRGLARLGGPTVRSSDQSPGLVEDIRRMRTASTGVLGRRGGSVILVTGLRKADGATFVSANLATASARSGNVTVVASGDLRNPGLAEYFGIVEGDRVGDSPTPKRRAHSRADGRHGPEEWARASNGTVSGENGDQEDQVAVNGARSATTTYDDSAGRARLGLKRSGTPSGFRIRQSGQEAGAEVVTATYEPAAHSTMNGAMLEMRLRPTGVDGLSMLMSLVGPGQDADALASEQVRAMIDATRAGSELVVIDSPPLFDFADPVILARYADLVIVVARSNRTRRKDLAQAVGILTDSGVEAVGVVVNSIKRWRPKKSGTPLTPDRSKSVRNRSHQED